MRIFLFIIIGSLYLAAPPAAFAAEVLLGTVVSLDRQAGEMQVELNARRPDQEGESRSEVDPQVITVQFNNEHPSLPTAEVLKAGDIVRVWGDFQQDKKADIFQARRIIPVTRHGRAGDPTGVRARMGKWRNRGGRASGGRGRGGGR